MTFRYDDFNLLEEDLKPLRHALYHSEGPGYYILKNFISPLFVDHYRQVWTQLEPYYRHEKLISWDDLHAGCPNYERIIPDTTRIFSNFFWNPPVDEVAHSVSLFITILRNRLEAKTPIRDLFPDLQSAKKQRASSYRIIITRNQDVGAPPHRDWIEPETYDLARLQATLFLSEWGVDYNGDGMVFTQNNGQRVVFGKDIKVSPGDLVLWRYNNQHAILNVSTSEEQMGFIRVIHPPETLVLKTNKDVVKRGSAAPHVPEKKSLWVNSESGSEQESPQDVEHTEICSAPPNSQQDSAYIRFKQRIKDTSFGRKYILPIVDRVKGRT